MKKVIVYCLLLGSLLNAEDVVSETVQAEKKEVVERKSSTSQSASKYYVGAGIAKGSGTLTQTLGTGYVWTATGTKIYEQDFDTLSVPVKVGYFMKNNNRFELSYQSMDLEYTGETETISGFDFDWLFVYNDFKDGSIYWTIGFGSYDYEGTGEYFTSGEDLGGASINFGAGFLRNIDKNIEIEVAYRGKSIVFGDILYSTTTIETDLFMTYFYVGANYKF